jgi:hypothetical protein
MPYCSGCGSRYQEGDTVCKSCGFELVYDVDPKTAGKHPTGTVREKKPAGGEGKTARSRRRKKPDSSEKPVLSGPDRGVNQVGEMQGATDAAGPAPHSESRCLQAEVIANPAAYNDIHLGKGIIKPKWIEVGLDGFHFKYEEPPYGMKKTEPMLKEVSAGYQSSAPGSMPPPALEVPPPETGDGLETGLERNEFPERLAPAVDADSGDSVNSPAELQINAQPAPVEPQCGETLPPPEEPVLAEVDPAESIGTPQNPVISPEPEIAAPVGREEEPVLEDSGSSGLESGRFIELMNEPATVLTVVNDTETETESSSWLSGIDAPVENRAVETAPESDAGIEPVNPTPEEADLPETTEEHNKIVWRGQQSWFGIPFPCFYQLTQNAVLIMDSNGKATEFEVSAIRRVTLRQSWFAKVLGIGDLILEFHDPRRLRQVLTGIANPNKAKSILEGLMSPEYNKA